MTEPSRIQFDRFAGPLPAGALLVTRATIFGNPWVVGLPQAFAWPKGARAGWRKRLPLPAGELDPAEAVAQFREWIERGHLALRLLPDLSPAESGALRTDLIDRRALIRDRLGALRGRHLACSCREGAPCHGDVLLELANG